MCFSAIMCFERSEHITRRLEVIAMYDDVIVSLNSFDSYFLVSTFKTKRTYSSLHLHA